MHPKQTLLWRLSFAMAIVAAIASVGAAYSQSQLPSRVNFVSDYAQVLDDPAEGDMNRLLDQVKKEMGVEIYILTVLTTNPAAINEYGSKISEAWNLGENDSQRKTLLFLVAVNDGLYRLVTNQGLEAAVTDEQLQQISVSAIQPSFENEQYAKGIASGVSQIIQILSKGGGSKTPGGSGQGYLGENVLVILLGLAVVVAVLAIVFLLLKL